ncbi:MAG: hypothetical protein JF567_09615 [Xanthomonadales bacterium]|nr:hypothetical protein [Xanthomonadales bacterium]
MTNRFQVDIVAADKYSKVFRDLNDKASRAVRPLASMGRQFSAIGKEMHLDKAGAGIQRLSVGVNALTRDLGLSLGPLESLFSVGRAGGILGGLAVAGGAAVALTARFGSLGFEVSRTAQNLNVSTDFLQRYRGAAKQAGVSSEALDGAVRGLGESLYRALYDGDARVMQTLQYLGISLKKNADGSINLEDALMGVSRAMAAYTDPMARRRIAEVFSIPEDAIPLLQRGEKGMQDLARKTAELGDVAGPKALAWANEFETSLNRLKVALEGVALRAGEKLIPKVPSWIDAATKAISPSPADAAPSAPKYPRGGTKPPPGFFDPLVNWWNDFDARSRAASPRAAHGAAVGAPTAGASAAAPATSASAAAGPADPLFDTATRRITGPRDVAREREAFQQGQSLGQQSVRVDINFNNPPDGMRTSTTTSSPVVQTRIGGTMNYSGAR